MQNLLNIPVAKLKKMLLTTSSTKVSFYSGTDAPNLRTCGTRDYNSNAKAIIDSGITIVWLAD